MIPLEKSLGLVVVPQSHFQNFTRSLVPTLGVRPRAEISSSFFQKLGGGCGDEVFLFLEPATSDWPRLVTWPGFSPLIGRDEEMLPSDDLWTEGIALFHQLGQLPLQPPVFLLQSLSFGLTGLLQSRHLGPQLLVLCLNCKLFTFKLDKRLSQFLLLREVIENDLKRYES